MSEGGNDRIRPVPPAVRKGEPVRADHHNQLRDAVRNLGAEVRARTLVDGAEIGARRSAGGTVPFLKKPPGQKGRAPGLMPVARGLGDSGTETPGVGLVLGHVHFLHVINGNPYATPKESVGVVPTLDGGALDADPPPRKTLTAGQWDAWVKFAPYSATVHFVGRGGSIGAIGTDERAVLVSQFTVTLPSDPDRPQVPRVEVENQIAEDELQAWIDLGEDYTGSGSSSSSGSGGGGGSSSSSSSKAAIVPAGFYSEGYAELNCLEAPEVLFLDRVAVQLRGRRSTVWIDGRFSLVCEPDTVAVYAATGDRGPVWATVQGGRLTVRQGWLGRSRVARVLLVGVRKGFRHVRLPARTQAQFLANEAFLRRARVGGEGRG